MIKKNMPFKKKEFIESLNNYIETYQFYNEGIVRELEERIEDYCGIKHALCVNSATNAIFMCLHNESNRYERNEVIIPNYGFPAASRVTASLGLTPICIDLEINTLSMNLDEVYKLINENTLAVIHVENNGFMGSVEEIREICPDDLLFIEDSAPSMLQTLNGKKAGTFGDVGIFSFSPTKPICSGEGGVIVTDDDSRYKQLKALRYASYNDPTVSLNFKLSPFLAVYLLSQFDFLDEIAEQRERVHAEYKKHINIIQQRGVTNRYGTIMYRSSNAELVHEKLNKFEVEHRYKYYPIMYEYPYSKEIRNTIIDLPMHHELTSDEIGAICAIIKRYDNE